MAACQSPLVRIPGPPSAGRPGRTGGWRQIVAAHLIFQDQRGLLTYRERAASSRGVSLCRLAVHGAKFGEFCRVVGAGLPLLGEWLDRELAPAPATPAATKAGKDRGILAREVLGKLLGRAGGASAAGVTPSPEARRPDPRIDPVIRHVAERACDCHEEVSLESAAKAAHMSRRHLRRVFKSGAGMTLKVFVTRFRVHMAAAMLVDEPGSKVTDIAFRSGPWDFSTFDRSFKSVMGVTPSQYRDRELRARESRGVDGITPRHEP